MSGTWSIAVRNEGVENQVDGLSDAEIQRLLRRNGFFMGQRELHSASVHVYGTREQGFTIRRVSEEGVQG